MTLTLETIAILLSILAFSITIIGFFASLRFYQNGMKLQDSANETLSKINLKIDSLQSQVTGMFDKTLDAALSRKEEISEDFESIQQKLKDSTDEILKKVTKDIEVLGKDKADEISKSVRSEFEDISKQLKAAREALDQTNIPYKIPTILQQSAIARRIISSIQNNLQMSESELLKLREGRESLIINRLNRLVRIGLIKCIKTEKETIYAITQKGIKIAQIVRK